MNRLTLPLLCLLLVSSLSGAEPASLRFTIAGKTTKELSLEDLKRELKTHQINFFNPHCDKKKNYAAFRITDVLQLVYDKEWEKGIYSDITFTALDGYKAVASTAVLKEPNGYLAYDDLDVKGWEPVGLKNAMPGPFYIVWTGKEQTTAKQFPWPWQVASISLLRFKDQYPEVYPGELPVTSGIHKGYELFKGRCFRCHSINQQGGKIGPDLNAPQSITRYRSPKMIKEFIKHPSKYRYTSMPDHPDLKEADLDALLDYFRHKAKPIKPVATDH